MPRFLTVLVFLLMLPGAQAIMRQYDSYFIPSDDGSRLFVMRPVWKGKSIGRDQHAGSYTLPDGRIVDVAATFPESGLYEVKSLKPLWIWEGYAHRDDFAISSDLSSFAVLVPQALEPNGVALGFFHEGKETARYRAHDLVKAFRSSVYLEKSLVDGFHLEWSGEMKADGQSLSLTTASRRYVPFYRESYRFDFASGKMTEAHVTSVWLVFGPALLLFGVLVVWLIRRTLRRRGIGIEPEAP